MKQINIGLLGCGTVGTGVAKLLIESQQVIRARLGTTLNLIRVADIDIETDRGIRFEEGVLTTDADALVNDPEIDIIIEMIGGEGIAKELNVPVIANGGSLDIKCFDDIGAFQRATGCSSVMIARSAQWNMSVFRRAGLLPKKQVVCE